MIRQLIGPETDPVYSTYFTRRLEAFNDIVFGFSLSLLATQLQPANFVHLDHFIASLLIFFLTFALMASIWYAHYLTFHYGFVAKGIDVLLNFALLAGAALVPYTFQLTVTSHRSAEESRIAFIPYAVDFAAVYSINAILKFRGLKRFGDRLEPRAQMKLFRTAAISAAVVPVMLVTLAIVAVVGPLGFTAASLLGLGAVATRRLKAVPRVFLPAGA